MTLGAEYDTEARAIGITLAAGDAHATRSDLVHERGRVALLEGVPVDVEVLHPERGIEKPLRAAAKRYDLDLEALLAAARSAIAAPDREVTLDVAAPSS
jgi:hypothetical protein